MESLFINKYKPKNIEDLTYDDDFKKLIHELIINETLNIIICGDSSSGKTTLIKLIINKYFDGIHKENEISNNIMFIHETKDQGIHYFRNELHLFCKTCSIINNKKKIVVLDDFDLINEQSQQVFRNLLDVYYNKVIFLMSCCNIHRIINSIQSRQLIINIPYSTNEKILNFCNKIISNEKINISNELLHHIISVSNNSIIRIINYLQKCYLIGVDLTLEDSSNILTHVNFKTLDDYFINLKNKNINHSIEIIKSLINKGYSVIDILDSFQIYLKDSNYKTLEEKEKYLITFYICKYISIFYDIHENDIELIFFTNNVYNIFK